MDVQEYSIIKIQAAIRVFLVRTRTLKQIRQRYEKIYDPRRKRFYYYDKEKDKSSWYKPSLLMNHDLDDIAPTFTRDEAATKIQCIVRRYLAKLRVRLLYQQMVMTVKDSQSNYEYYYNPLAGTTRWELPNFMLGRLNHQRKPPRKNIPKPKKKNDSSNKQKKDDKAEEIIVEEKEEVKEESSDSDDESDAESETSEMRREKRRQNRKFPRSKVQAIVDTGEDDIPHTFELDLSNIGSKRFSSRIYDLINLRRLNMSYNYLKRISDNIQYLTKLQYLDVRHNLIRYMPQEMEELKDLTEFYAGHNRLSTYSANFYKLKKIQRLDFSYNKFVELPLESGNLELVNELGEWEVGIGMFKNLLYLDLRGNLFEKFPEQLERLEQLEELYLSENKLTEIPTDLGGLENLKILFIQFNKINRIAKDLYYLQRLQELKANHNELFELPSFEDVSPATTHENIPESPSDKLADENNGDSENNNDNNNDSNAASLPAAINVGTNKSKAMNENGPLISSLKIIDMSYNKFVHLDSRWSKFTALKTLNLSYNQLETMSSDCFQDCRALTYLDLSHNQLTDISLSLTSAIHLTFCDLSYNKLNDAPQGLFRATKLKTLKLQYNTLQDLTGKVMGMLYDLESLEVQHNQLTRLPSLLYGLKKVKYVDISHNRIQELSNEECGSQWTTLQYFDISYNQIPFIPIAIGNTCDKSLEIFYCHHNCIQELPTSITKLKRLKKFTIYQNQLKKTRNVLAMMPWLLHCNLSWNREKVVKKSFVPDRQPLNDEERRFTLFGNDLDAYYEKQNPSELQPLTYIRKRLYGIQESLESVVSSMSDREKAFTMDITPFLGENLAQKRGGKPKKGSGGGVNGPSNYDTLMKWLTKLRDHVVLEEANENEESGKNGNTAHSGVRDQLYSIYQAARMSNKNGSSNQSKKTFHDLLVQVLSAKLRHSSRTQTKVYFSNFQFRQMRPLMYYPFFLDQFKHDNKDEYDDEDEEEVRDHHKSANDQQYLKEDIINALFMGFEVIPSIEKLCEVLNDLNILAMIEEINALRKSDQVRERIEKLKSTEENKDSPGAAKKRKESVVPMSSPLKAATTATSSKTPSAAGSSKAGTAAGGSRFSLFSSSTTSKKKDAESDSVLQSLEAEESDFEREEKRKLAMVAKQEGEEDSALQSYALPSEPLMHFYPPGEDPTPITAMNEISTQQEKDNYFMALMSRIAPYIDVDLFDRQSIAATSTAKGATMSAIPLMSFPYLTLLKQDQDCLNKYDKDFLYATSHQENPFQDSLLTYFFEVYLMLLKALVLHIEYVQKAMRTLERISAQKFSRLSTLCQRDSYYCLREDPKTKETKLERQEDYEDLLSDIYSAIQCDQQADEKKSADESKTVGMKKKKMIKEFADQFFAQGELEGIEFLATESIFKKFGAKTEEEQGPVTGDTQEGEGKETDDVSVGSTKSMSMDKTEEEDAGLAVHIPIPAREKLIAALGLPTSEDIEKEKTVLEDLNETLLLIDMENPSPKELQEVKRVEAKKQEMKAKKEARELEANHRIRVWLDFLQEYRGLLMTWATQCNENAMSVLQCRGFDSRQPQEGSEWLLPGKHISYDYHDPRYWQQEEKTMNTVASAADLMKQSLIPRTTLYFSISPIVVRVVEDEARRLMMYRYRLYQCFPQYQDSVLSYEIFLRYSKGFIPLNAYVGFVRVCLSQGDYTKALSLLTTTWRKFFGKEIKAYWEKVAKEAAQKGIARKKRIIISDDHSLLEIPKAADLLPINRELAVLWKFTEIQLEALNKVNVFSKENHRVFRIREDGLLRKNNDYPAPEIVHGRDLQYRQRIEQLEKEKQMRAALEEKQQAQDELLDGIVSVKSKLLKLLQDDNIISLAKSMNLNDLLK